MVWVSVIRSYQHYNNYIERPSVASMVSASAKLCGSLAAGACVCKEVILTIIVAHLAAVLAGVIVLQS